MVSRNQSGCDAVAAQICSEGGAAIGVRADVSSEDDVAAMVKAATQKFEGVDVLVNNAGVNLPYTTVAELTLEQWNWVLSTNLTGTFLCSRAVIPVMTAQHSGKIINLASIGGRHGAAAERLTGPPRRLLSTSPSASPPK